MQKIVVKKGFDLNIPGNPSSILEGVDPCQSVAVLPEKIDFIRPRLLVKKGDSVRVGTPLFEDKRNKSIRFLSPGGGVVEEIDFGPRRVIQKIVIRLDAMEQFETFETVSVDDLDTLDSSELTALIVQGGLWPLIKALPFRDIADPNNPASTVIISLGSREPFLPDPDVYLKGHSDLFKFGLKVISKLVHDAPLVCGRRRFSILDDLGDLVTHRVTGAYPADDPGVLLYHTKKTSSQNSAWYLRGQDVLLIAELLASGRYPIRQTIAVGGSLVADGGRHLFARVGMPVSALALPLTNGTTSRYVVGGLFNGYRVDADGYMGFGDTSLMILPEGNEREGLASFLPGWRKPSFSGGFLSRFNSSFLDFDCNLHGGRRACIACGYCTRVCPVDIFPQLAYKSVLVGEVEEYLAYGLLDCVECGLCSYVCPSKIELRRTLAKARAEYAKEQAQI